MNHHRIERVLHLVREAGQQAAERDEPLRLPVLGGRLRRQPSGQCGERRAQLARTPRLEAGPGERPARPWPSRDRPDLMTWIGRKNHCASTIETSSATSSAIAAVSRASTRPASARRARAEATRRSGSRRTSRLDGRADQRLADFERAVRVDRAELRELPPLLERSPVAGGWKRLLLEPREAVRHGDAVGVDDGGVGDVLGIRDGGDEHRPEPLVLTERTIGIVGGRNHLARAIGSEGRA